MNTLPDEMIELILLKLSIRDIIQFISINKEFKYNTNYNNLLYRYIKLRSKFNIVMKNRKLITIGEYIRDPVFFNEYDPNFNYYQYIRIYYICRFKIEKLIDMHISNLEWYYQSQKYIATTNSIYIYREYNENFNYRIIAIGNYLASKNAISVYEMYHNLEEAIWKRIWTKTAKSDIYDKMPGTFCYILSDLLNGWKITHKRAVMILYMERMDKIVIMDTTPMEIKNQIWFFWWCKKNHKYTEVYQPWIDYDPKAKKIDHKIHRKIHIENWIQN